LSFADSVPSWVLPEDMAELVESGETEAIRGVFQIFLEDTRLHLEELSQGVDSGDGHKVARLAHTLKGGCAQVGAYRLSQIAAALEASGREPRDWRILCGMLRAEFARVESQVLAHPILTGESDDART